MKRYLSCILFALVLMVSLLPQGRATDSSANVTLNYVTPLSVTEITPYSVVFTRKPGVPKETSISNLSIHTGTPSTYNSYFKSIQVTPGCFKITGEPNKAVRITASFPSNIGPVTISNPQSVFRWKFTKDGCASPSSYGWALTTNTDNLSSTGELYVTYGTPTNSSAYLRDFVATVSITSLEDATFSATAVVTVEYTN